MQPPRANSLRDTSATQAAVWLAFCAATGLGLAWPAAVLEALTAPILLFPLAAGLVLGAVGLVGLRRLELGSRRLACGGMLAAAVLFSLGLHYAHFRHAATLRDQQQRTAAEAFPLAAQRIEQVSPEGFAAFLRREAEGGRRLAGDRRARGVWAWLWWLLDAALVAGAALVLVNRSYVVPYCGRCRRWYRPIRQARLDAAAAQRLGQWLAGWLAGPRAERPPADAAAQCVVRACPGGCGPYQLTVSWKLPGGASASAAVRQVVWLDAPRHRELEELWDRLSCPGASSASVPTSSSACESPK